MSPCPVYLEHVKITSLQRINNRYSCFIATVAANVSAVMKRYFNHFINLVSRASSLPAEEIAQYVKAPDPKQGDISLPCFSFAKRIKKNPAEIAKEIVSSLDDDPRFSIIESVGPYINATLNPAHLMATIIPEVRTKGDKYCCDDTGAGKTVVIDYSSPNIAKPLGFHHLRSTMIGHALLRMHQALGYRTIGINFLGDWGKTFGLLAETFTRFGDDASLQQEGISYLMELYVKANKLVKEDPDYDEAARAMFRAQERGDARALELWELFRSISLREFQKIYNRLGVSFDYIEGESHYRDGLDKLLGRIAKSPGIREDRGAQVVDMEYGPDEPPMMLRKSDGATLYATRDIAAAIDRYERFDFEKSLYVVGVEQRQHFDQLKRALNAMGHDWAERMTHVHFGRVQGMSTRQGNVVFLEQVLDEARDRAREKIEETGSGRGIDIEAVSEQVGIGGIVFGDLKNLRTSDYKFDWEEILNPKGFTGICVQYAHARCCSILNKGGGAPQTVALDADLLTAMEEVTLVKELAKLPGAVQDAAQALEPSKLARALYEVARAWNRYQQAGNADGSLRILVDDVEKRRARLALVDAVRIGLKNGLALLGIDAPLAM
jgi:arginyl-tRNA synthetase